MPEDNFAECIAVIAKTVRGTGRPGQWYGMYLSKKKVLSSSAIYAFPSPRILYLLRRWLEKIQCDFLKVK